jgi:hypothetical protein
MRIAPAMMFALAVAACGQSATAPKAPDAPPSPPPVAAACNDVAINPAVKAETQAAAASARALLGGPIAPGTYDLVTIEPGEGATVPAGDLWESVRVRDSEEGIVLEFAIVRGAPTNQPHRVNALLTEGAAPSLVHMCGAEGSVPAAYAASAAGLQLQLPSESGAGQVSYVFSRRGG